jgi:Tfp pilus assembly protein PilF
MSWPRVRRAATLGLSAAALLLATACAHHSPSPRTAALPPTLLAAHLYSPQPPRPTASELFALDAAMQDWAERELLPRARRRDARRVLIEALYGKEALRYDASHTRSAAEAWHAKAGNCLSLVVMTAAFARHLGLPVSFREVLVDQQYTQAGGLTLASGHVNLLLAQPVGRRGARGTEQADMTVDFLPAAERLGHRSAPLAEATVLAMFMNNRAVETLALGQHDEAFAWVQAAVQHDPAFSAGLNTLAVIHQRAGHVAQAEAVLRHVIEQDPQQTAALSNLVQLLRQQGREREAPIWAARLATLQPLAPLHHLRLGHEALAAGRAADARRHFERELQLQPSQYQAHEALAHALWALGERRRALRHLRLAADYSASPAQQRQYHSKLQALRAQAAVTDANDPGAALRALP